MHKTVNLVAVAFRSPVVSSDAREMAEARKTELPNDLDAARSEESAHVSRLKKCTLSSEGSNTTAATTSRPRRAECKPKRSQPFQSRLSDVSVGRRSGRNVRPYLGTVSNAEIHPALVRPKPGTRSQEEPAVG